MKSILIITTYTSTNCGSFFQAKSLYEYLTDIGYKVSFYNIHNDIFTQYIRDSLNSRDYKRFLFLVINRIKFVKYFKLLPVSNKSTNEDIVVFGSDAIWDVSRTIFADIKFYDINEPCKKKLTYAISVDKSTADMFSKYENIEDKIREFDTLLVRDNHTKETLEKITNRNCASVVLDPTLLWNAEHYSKLINESIIKKEYSRYILLYGNISLEKQSSVRRLANAYDMKIVSLGFYNSFADVSITASPETFITYFVNAQCVITDMFHGICFSLIFKKNVIVSEIMRTKVRDAVVYWGLESRVMDKKDPISIFVEEIDYNDIYSKIDSMQKFSKEQMESQLK